MVHRLARSFLLSALFIHSINAQPLQEKDTSIQNTDNLIISIQQKLRNPEYTKEILPNDFSSFSQLLTFGHNNAQPALYARSVVNSFTNLLKRSQYVNSKAFSALLENLPMQLMPYFALPASRAYIADSTLYDASFGDRFGATVNSMLYSKFSTEYESFRQDPNVFLRSIGTNIVAAAQEEMMQAQVRQSIIRFCEIALSKLIWDPAAQEATWATTKKISEQLARLLELNILDDTNDLEDLYATLLNRYCYFIEITATDMPASFFAAIRNDLKSNDLVLFALTEQDTILEPKLVYMQRTLIEAETVSYRHRAGLSRL
jgi:hypothetical protein